MSIDRRDRAAFSRRDLLGHMASGLGGVALCALLGREGQARAAAGPVAAAAAAAATSLPHFAPKAKRVLQIFCPGGFSHLDSFDFKPQLLARDGQPNPGEDGLVSFQGKNGPLMRSPWGFTRRGQCGKFVSDMLPNLGAHVDDIAFVHSMTSRTNTPGPGCIFMNTGFATEGFPSAGAWASYALGSLNDNLPAYVAIPDVRGEPPNGKANWSAGFLPARHQGIEITASKPIRNLARPG